MELVAAQLEAFKARADAAQMQSESSASELRRRIEEGDKAVVYTLRKELRGAYQHGKVATQEVEISLGARLDAHDERINELCARLERAEAEAAASRERAGMAEARCTEVITKMEHVTAVLAPLLAPRPATEQPPESVQAAPQHAPCSASHAGGDGKGTHTWDTPAFGRPLHGPPRFGGRGPGAGGAPTTGTRGPWTDPGRPAGRTGGWDNAWDNAGNGGWEGTARGRARHGARGGRGRGGGPRLTGVKRSAPGAESFSHPIAAACASR